MRMQRAHLRVAFGRVLDRVMRMHAGGGEPFAGPGARQGERGRRVLAAGTGEDGAGHAGRARTLPDRITVAVEAVVGEVESDVDQFHAPIVGAASADRVRPAVAAEAAPTMPR